MKGIMQALHYRVAVLVAAAGLLSADTAFAFTSECNNPPWFSQSCPTLGVPANTASHTVTMNIHSFWTSYQLKDDGNQVILRQGSTGANAHYETIGGLYNTAQGYKLYCSGPVVACELNND